MDGGSLSLFQICRISQWSCEKFKEHSNRTSPSLIIVFIISFFACRRFRNDSGILNLVIAEIFHVHRICMEALFIENSKQYDVESNIARPHCGLKVGRLR